MPIPDQSSETETRDAPFLRLPAVAPGPGFALLEGLRVLDLTTSVAGPYAALLLGDLGVAADPDFAARGLFYRLRDRGREVPQVGTGLSIDGAPNAPRRAPPRLGEHTKDVLSGVLDYSDDRIRALSASGVI